MKQRPYDEIREQARALRSKHAERLNEIERNRDLTPDAKRRMADEQKASFKEKMSELRGDFYESKESARDGLRRSVFALRHSLGTSQADKHAAQTRYLAAIETASNAKTKQHLIDTLERANKLGDDVLRQASIFVADERGFSDLVREAIPDDATRADYDELRALDGMTATEKIAEKIDFSAV